MADAYWRYGDARQQSAALPFHLPKRPRTDYEMPSGHDISSYYTREDDRGGQRDGHSINATYDRYIRIVQHLYSSESGRSMSGGLHHIDDAHGSSDRPAVAANSRSMGLGGRSDDPRVLAIGHSDPAVAVNSWSMELGGQSDDRRALALGHSNPAGAANSRSMGLGGQSDDLRVLAIGHSDPAVAANSRSMGLGGWSEVPVPADASSTLFVEGLPANCTCREVAHIFRPFIGYKEVRLVIKESRYSGREATVLCFVDFQSPVHAATAMDAVQGYKFDEHDRDSVHLRVQFARYPGARSRGGHRGTH